MDNQPQDTQLNTDTIVTQEPVITTPTYRPPVPTEPVAVPKKTDKTITIVLIVIAVLMLLFVVGVYFANPYLVEMRMAAVKTAEIKPAELNSDTTDYSVRPSTENSDDGILIEEKQVAEKAIRDFFGLLSEKKFAEAVDSMSRNKINSENVRQGWISNFSNWSSVKIVSLELVNPQGWYKSEPQYQVKFNVVFDPTKNNNYSYAEGLNIRYVFVINEDNVKKVHSLPITTDAVY